MMNVYGTHYWSVLFLTKIQNVLFISSLGLIIKLIPFIILIIFYITIYSLK